MIVVDDMQDYPRNKDGFTVEYVQRCHLMTDEKTQQGLDKLHEFAKRIGLDRLYFEDTAHFPRYVLNVRLRELAVAAGAVQVSSRNMLAMCCWPHRRKVVQVNLEQRRMFDDE